MCCDCEQASVVVVSRQRLSHVFISTGSVALHLPLPSIGSSLTVPNILFLLETFFKTFYLKEIFCSIKYVVFRMFTRLQLCLIIVLAIISLTTAGFSCFFGDFLCKQVVCKGCSFSACINSECTCKFCS
ncbi:unnamed protein product [Angiostrongylus costaricensis]|uniref:Uncharacterized protein n=1 Tax=Angiostrongylus costaricensis TaxID=334426 RepID=A0A0R3PKE7_ANGCS|nr:unnamed protein product [Angiostrongylus costaricensis]